tara:strand:+ start:169 stop:900 length:732 start_codon:yes stop_codon:yes gene_type:complete
MVQSKIRNGLSIIIPTKNEENIIIENLDLLYQYLKNITHLQHFELIISDYSNDNTEQLALDFIKKHEGIKYFKIKTKGIGAGLKAGIDNAVYKKVIFYPIDLAYDIKSIENMSKKIDAGYDIVFGSRRHHDAVEKKPLNRRILSDIYSTLIKLFLKITIKDTQGVFAMNINKINFFEKLKSDDGFFQTELALYGKLYNAKITEIPVSQIEPQNRQTKTNQFILGYHMLKKVIKTYLKLRNNKL